MPISAEQRARTKKDIEKCLEELEKHYNKEANTLNDQIKEIDQKQIRSGTLTDAEEKERTALTDGLSKLQRAYQAALIANLGLLDNTAEVKILLEKTKAANDDLAAVKKEIEDLSKALKDAGDFINGLAGTITKLAGLLAILA